MLVVVSWRLDSASSGAREMAEAWTTVVVDSAESSMINRAGAPIVGMLVR